MKNFIAFLFALLIAFAIDLLMAWPLMLLWNWLMPIIFGLPVVTFWQAFGLMLLVSLFISNNLTFKK